MTNLFQQTFHHIVAANNALLVPPPLRPAPSVPPTLPASASIPLPVLHPAPSAAAPAVAPPPPPPPNRGPVEFILSKYGKPKLLHEGYSYTFHKKRETTGNVSWRCDLTNLGARKKGIFCYSTAVTTGTTSTSTLEYAKPHTHLPNPGHVGALKVRSNVKTVASQNPTMKPHAVVASSLSNLPGDVHLNLPERPSSLKRSIQRKRKADSVSANPDLALCCDRSLILLNIPPTLLQPWMHFDSGPSNDRILIFTTASNLDLLRQSGRWCGDGTFKAAPKLWSQLYTIHGLKNGYTVACSACRQTQTNIYPSVRPDQVLVTWLDAAGGQWGLDSFLSDYT